ncbi:MarR family winged helix-turn-helix transcriptional regulator [Filimonas effusa]|uniref:MarR family transcriptional regulator n=1 Tax=Filimonas effusa TaxID=2508721 RepID=A0A4Q1DB88_9BACT|nr:MarR family winged helix-turn-helix transcriptional regulator [Filimonas effusa]RXK86178.1 MarR family transcriptional regulator [Filimonas effusa]
MNFYQSLGFLVFGSRLKRLGDTFLGDVSAIYKAHQIPFDASWFPVFYLLSREKEVSIKDIAETLNTSHSAASQMVSNLEEKGLIKTTASASDARRKVVTFTSKGSKLLQKIQPVWEALQQAMQQLAHESAASAQVLTALTELENNIQANSLFNRVEACLTKKESQQNEL